MPPQAFVVTLSCGHLAKAPPTVRLHEKRTCERCNQTATVIGIGGTGR